MAEPLIYDPFAYAMHEDPYPTYRRLREEAPAYYNPERQFWALSRHQDVLAAFQDWPTYSSAQGITLEAGSGEAPPMMIAMDPPRQMQLRKLVSKAFTPRRIAELEPAIRALARKHLAPIVARGACDFIQDFAAKLPMDVISTMLGVPDGDQDMLRLWSDALLHREPGVANVTEAGRAAAQRLVHYFREHITRRRARPGEDLVSALLAAEQDGQRLADAEILGFCFLLVIAGNETTTKLLGNAIVLLDQHPDQRALLRADPARIADAVDEVLRFDTSTHLMARTLTRDVVVHDHTMEAGAKVVLLIASGNRDEGVFVRPDAFDVTRKPVQLLSFGHGVHVCLGASLARLEARVALEEVQSTLGDCAVDAAALVRVHSANVRGFARVPVTLRAA